MDISVYSNKKTPNSKIIALLEAHESFVIDDVDRINMSESVTALEKLIESCGMKCRVYTKGRVATLAAELAVPVVGWAAAVAMGMHNLATWNPDYEIGKNMLTGTLTVKYKK